MNTLTDLLHLSSCLVYSSICHSVRPAMAIQACPLDSDGQSCGPRFVFQTWGLIMLGCQGDHSDAMTV